MPPRKSRQPAGWRDERLERTGTPGLLSDELAKAAKDFPAPATAAGAPATEPIGVFDLDDNTLVIAQPKEAARIIALLKGQGASYALHPSLRPQVNATGRPYAVVSVNAAKLPPSADLTNSGFKAPSSRWARTAATR